jgi:hypothetical protein
MADPSGFVDKNAKVPRSTGPFEAAILVELVQKVVIFRTLPESGGMGL